MKIVYLGDLVGRSGRKIVAEKLPEIKERLKPDAIIVTVQPVDAQGNLETTLPITRHLATGSELAFQAAELTGSGVRLLPPAFAVVLPQQLP